MSKEDMVQARELIKQKRFDEARAILRATNHHQAAAWLKKLDEIDPPNVDPEATWIDKKPPLTPPPIADVIPAQKEEKKIPLPLVIGCLGLVIIAGICIFGGIWLSSRAATFFGGVTDFYDDFSTAQQLTIGTPVGGVLSEANEFTEYWVFNAAAGDNLVITLRSAQVDTLVSLYHDNRSFIIDDDDSGGGILGTDSQIEYTIPSDGRYIIVAGQWSIQEGGGSYTLTVTRQ
jgi:hypothetical protein